MAIASDSENNHVSLRHSLRHFPKGNLVLSIVDEFPILVKK